MLEASIVVIGDEILGGFVPDTNSGWIARRLQHHGVPLTRVHTVPDSFAAIDEALQRELTRSRPRVVFTSGGVGSTPDDVTYEALARSLGRDLVVEPTIAGRIERALEWTSSQGLEVTDELAWHMMRMARVPEGATLLNEHRGWAPGIRVDVDGGADADGVSIVVLPGVPSQLRGIVRDAVEPQLLADRNEQLAVVEVTHGFPESVLNLCFARLLEDWPAVKLGSYPGVPMLVRLTGPEPDVQGARADVEAFVDQLESSPAGARLAEAWAERMGAAPAGDRTAGDEHHHHEEDR